MNKLIILGGILVLSVTSLDAREIGVRPRLNVGMMNYDFSQPAIISTSTESVNDSANVIPMGTSKFSAGSSTPMVRTGFSIFVDRAFFDFDFQYAFDAHGNTRFTSWAHLDTETFPVLPADHFLRFDTHAEGDFERTELALTLGYSVTDQLSIYAGYKRADSNTSFDFNGDIRAVPADDFSNSSLFYQFTAKLDQELIYQGPFLGTTYTWNTNSFGPEGALTVKVGLAFLEADSNNAGLQDFLLAGENGDSIPINTTSIDRPPFNINNLKGNTVGLSFAVAWNGYTPIESLMYSVGLSSYQYDFEGTSGSQDFTIDVLRFDTGINYFFDF